jgi:hypothetical protein
MSSNRRWVYKNGRLSGAVTTTRHSNGSVCVTRQTASPGFIGNRAGRITGRTTYTKPHRP